jgi:hypothetical protein
LTETAGDAYLLDPALEDAAARDYRTRIADTLDGASSVRRDLDGGPSE